MTVLQVLGIHPKKLGGFENYILAFARLMHERGHRTVFIFAGDPHPYIKGKMKELECHYFVFERPLGIYGYLSFFARLMTIILKYRPNIIQGQFHPQLHFAALAGFLTRTPAFITIRSTTSQNNRPIMLTNIIKAKISSLLSQKTIAVSKAVSKDLTDNLHIPPKNILVLYNGVDLERYKPNKNDFLLHKAIGISENKKVILTVANARPEKGLEYLIKAIPEIVSSHNDIHFVFCGGGPLENSLIKLSKDLGVLEYVSFLGIRNDVHDLLNRSYLSVLPSIAEPLGRAVLEAMAMMKAVVATSVDGIPEMVQHNVTGLLVPPRDSDSLAASIIYLLNDTEKTEKMGIEGRKRIEKDFDLKDRVITEIRLYEDYMINKL